MCCHQSPLKTIWWNLPTSSYSIITYGYPAVNTVQAARGLTLAKRTDVAFGPIPDGRSLDLPGVETIEGICNNPFLDASSSDSTHFR